MNMRGSILPVSIFVLLLALAAWAGAWYLFSDVSARLSARAEANTTAAIQSEQTGSAIELHALVADTATQRGALDDEVDTDVVGIANQIDAAGKAAGATTAVGSASLVQALPASSGVNEVEFVVQSTGTFAEVWEAAQLFASLPLPSKLSEVDFQQVPGSQGGSWQLTVHIDVLTSAQISS